MSLSHAASVFGQRITQGPTLAFFILMLALVLGPRLAQKARLPAMVGLVLAGMVLGPHTTRLLDSNKIALSALGTFGLLYLMFAAGLELDFKRLMRNKGLAITFALLSFAIPFSFGVASARALHYAWAGAVLMGSNWGSHTLVTYPMLRKMGLARNRAVGTVVGATAVTDTSALLVLSAVSVSAKKTGGLELQAVEIVLGLVLLVAYALFVLPKLARWFFARVGGDRSLRLVFGIAAFLSGAVLAEMASIDGIVGAFLVGLGLNRVIPERSPLMEQVQFVGSALFIPVFLVSVGVLLDPRVLIDPRTLLVAAVFTVAVLGGKALAAVIAGRTFHFTWAEIGVMSGLSGSQAAATLATTLVGARLGIFDKTTINAVLVVILVTLVITPAMVSFFGRRVSRQEGAGEALGSTILVPVWGESTRPLLSIAGKLAVPDGGMVVVASLATELASETEVSSQRALASKAEEWLAKEGLESRSVFRVSSSISAGLLQTARGQGATLLLCEWQSESPCPSSEPLGALYRSPVPVVLVRGDVHSFERVVVIARQDDFAVSRKPSLDLAVEIATRVEHGHRFVCVGRCAKPLESLFAAQAAVDKIDSADPLAWANDNAGENDLLVFAGRDAAREALTRFPGLAKKKCLVAIAPSDSALQPHPEASDALVASRSLAEDPAR
ncbi:MAG TPA: cation:proton antiporter [Polyangiaceae bacterium]|nr:cation:proton antiporter [Polyangiaceae bacterium]